MIRPPIWLTALAWPGEARRELFFYRALDRRVAQFNERDALLARRASKGRSGRLSNECFAQASDI